jgi:hypothetical protein
MLLLGIWILSSEGFCYERHNGVYCYKGASLVSARIFPLIISLSAIVSFFEQKTTKAVHLMKHKLSFVVFSASIVFLFISVFLAGLMHDSV